MSFDNLRTGATKVKIFNTEEEAKKFKKAHPKLKTRLSRYRDYKDRKGN